jgi:hypothetical protein
MSGTRSTHGRYEKCIQNIGSENLKGRDQRPRRRCENIMYLGEWVRKVWSGFILLRIGTTGGTLWWRRFLHEKLVVTQLVRDFLTFYGSRMSITVFTKASHCPLFWARCIQSTLLHRFLKIHSSTIFPTTLRLSKWSLCFSNGLLAWNYVHELNCLFALTEHHSMKAYWGMEL